MDQLLELALLNALLTAALAVLVALVTGLVRRPALAHALWLLVLIKLITPPLFAVELPWPSPLTSESSPAPEHLRLTPPRTATELPVPSANVPEMADANELPLSDQALPGTPVSHEPAGTRGESKAPEDLPPTLPVLPASLFSSWHVLVAGLWLTGSCLWWLLAAWRLSGFRRLLRAALPASPFVQARAEALAAQLGLAHCPPIRFLPGSLPPLLWALLGKPCVYLPERLWGELTYRQQETLLAHELAHLRRRDHWVRWLELLVLGVYWWHPAAWWARRRIHQAEELLCDARVLRTLPGAADAYARALIQTVSFLSGPRPALPGAASGMGQVRPLKARVTMIMRGTNTDRLPRASAWSLVVVGLALLLLRPAWASSPASAVEADEPAPTVQVTPVPDQLPADKQPPYTIQYRVLAKPDVPGRVRVVLQTEKAPPGMYPPATALAVGQQAALDADQEIQLLRAQLAARNAELQEARVLLRQATKRFERLQRMHKTGSVAVEEMDQAQADMEVQQARVQGKEAQTREAQLRLEAVQRRMGQPSNAPRNRGTGTALPRAGAAATDVPAGGPPNPRISEQPPGTTPRFAPGTAAPGGPYPPGTPVPAPKSPGAYGRADARSAEDRLQKLERRLETLFDEIQALRAELAATRRGASAGSGRRQGPTPEAADPARSTPVRPPEGR
jgi:beta-lactamase regulating signal transducer with metallopeptidase domain